MKIKQWLVKILDLVGIKIKISFNDVSVSDVMRGMKNITRMRQEIDMFISGLNGRLKAMGLFDVRPGYHDHAVAVREYLGPNLRRDIESGDVTWIVGWKNDRGYLLQFRRLGAHPNLSFVCEMNDPSADDIPFTEVQAVYKGLQVLFNDLVEHFPDLREDVDVVVKAADVFEDDDLD